MAIRYRYESAYFPVHNLFLGTAKHFLKAVWLESGVISQAQFQHRVDLATVPSGIGRVPYKISSGFSSFTADQWKHWAINFFLISLHDIFMGIT